MNYTISPAKRNLMILSAAFLTVYTLYNAYFFHILMEGAVKPDAAQMVIRDLLFAVPYVYLLIVLFDYFRYHGWKVLQSVVLLAAIIEIASKMVTWVNAMGPLTPTSRYYSMSMGLIWFAVILIQAILILRLNRKENPEVFALQKYAVALIVFQLIAFAIPVVIHSANSTSMMVAIRIISAVPYLFLIEFTLKLKSEKRNMASNMSA